MAERDRAAVDVEPVRIDRQFLAGRPGPARRRLRSSRRDRSRRAPGPFARGAFRTAGTGPMPKRSGWHAGGRVRRRRAPSGVRPSVAGARVAHDDDRRGAVARLRRVAGGHRAAGVKRRAQLRQRVERRVAPRAFVDGERTVSSRSGRPSRPVDHGSTSTATISSANRPASIAATAR